MRRAPRRSQPTPIAHVLRRVLQRPGLNRGSEFAVVAHTWPRAVAPEVAERTRPIGLRDGVLTVRVASAPLLEELRCFRTGEILQRLNHALAGGPGPSVQVRGLDLRLG